MDWITQPETWIAFLTLVALELVLGVDNVIFISILAGKLPQSEQKRARQTGIMLAVLTVSSLTLVASASAEDVKMVGTISEIKLAADGKSAVATLKDSKTEASVAITITDELTLDKLKDKRIVDGDEIRTKFEKEGDKNTSKIFKKTAGC